MQDTYKPSAARQKLLSDDKIKYFYTKSGKLHIKTCEMARNIPDSELQYSNTFVEGIPICEHCEREIYVRGIAKSTEEYKTLLFKFNEIQINTDALQRLATSPQITYVTPVSNGFIVQTTSDRWRIEIIRKSQLVVLLHNDWHLKNGKRVFLNTFHIQKSNCDIYAAISRILKYDPLYHVNKVLTRQSAISEPKTATIGKTYKRLLQLMRCRLYLLRHCYTTNLVVVIGKVLSEFNIKEHDGEKVQIFNIQIVDGNNNIEQTIICPAEILSKANTKIEIGDTIAIVGKLTNKKIVNNKQTVRKNIIYAKKVF